MLAVSALSAQPLSLDRARQIAMENNNDYQIKRAEYNAAKWSKTNALGSMLPSLSLGGNYIYSDPATTVQSGAGAFTLNNDMRTISLNLSQPIFLGGKLWQAYKISQISEEMAALALKNAELKLFQEVESKYLNVQLLETLQKLGEMELASATKNLEMASLKYDNGLISAAELYRFQANKASSEVSVLQSNTALQLARRDLVNYLGLDYVPQLEEMEIALEDPMLELLIHYGLNQTEVMIDRSLRMAAKNNLGISIMESSVSLSKRAYNISKSAFLPSIMLTGSRQFKENGIDRYEYKSSDQIVLSVSIPLLPQISNYAGTRKAYYDYRVNELNAKTAIDGINLGVESAVLNLISSAKQVKASSLALQYTEQSYEQMQERYRQNMLSSSDLIDIELMINAARTSNVNAVFAYLKNKTALQNLIGSTENQVLLQIIEQ